MNWIDTAPFYGWGRSEGIVVKAIRDRREEVYIFTKCGAMPDKNGEWTETDCRPETMRREVEESLKRLGTDHIDVLQLHEPDPNTPIEESWNEMQHLIKKGKVRYGGLSNHPPDLIESAEDWTCCLKPEPVQSFQTKSGKRSLSLLSRTRYRGSGLGIPCLKEFSQTIGTSIVSTQTISDDNSSMLFPRTKRR